jgi:tRNA-splicing ligase RtcB (3'-phosphate/5'-hydroxy nucleic acid ligase)
VRGLRRALYIRRGETMSVSQTIDGNILIAWGFRPGRWFKDALEAASTMRAGGADDDAIFVALQALQPIETLMRTNGLQFSMLIDAENELERANIAAVAQHMDALMRVPTIVAGAVMPDACPSGTADGTIPVGGVVACEDAIHPGFHSSDICCSVAMTVFARKDDPKRILDAGMSPISVPAAETAFTCRRTRSCRSLTAIRS